MTAKTRTADTSTRTMDMGNNETISQGVQGRLLDPRGC